MAGYDARQSTITDGNIGYDSLWNDEYNAILAAFAALTGHKHDGSAGEGGYVNILSDVDAKNKIYVDAATDQIDFYSEVAGVSTLQFSLLDGQLLPATTNDVDLGSATKAFKDLYIAGASTLTSVAVSGGTIDDTTIGATTPSTGRFTTAESTVATGTAPLIVASTTVVTNLNADKLDGQDAPTGTIVGTTDTQTVTNKTINLSSNTVTGTLAELNTAVSDDNLAGLGTTNVFTVAQDFSTAGIYIGGSAADNLLDNIDTALDWTPVVSCTTPGDLAITYGQQAGYGTVIANRLFFNIYITMTAYTHSTASGSVTVTLPATSAAGGGNFATPDVAVSRWTPPAGYTIPTSTILPSSAIITLQKNGITDTAKAGISVGELSTASGTIILEISGDMRI